MADVTITVASVLADVGSSGANSPTQGIAAVDLTQMQPVYQDTTGYKPADANANVTRAKATAVTLNAAKAGQPVSVLTGGGCNPGFSVTVGTQYVVSHNSGRIAPSTDLVSGDYKRYLFMGDAANHVTLNIGGEGVLVQVP